MATHHRNINIPKGRAPWSIWRLIVLGLFLWGLLYFHLPKQNLPWSLSSGILRDSRTQFIESGGESLSGDNTHNPLNFIRKGDISDGVNDDWQPNVIFGNYSMPITFDTKQNNAKDIQRAFDTGLVECYGFAFFEARKTANKILQDLLEDSQRNSQGLSSDDPYCPMCYWLLAMGHSPYINHPLIEDVSDFESARKAADKAYEQAYHHPPNKLTSRLLSTKELGLINALQLRFSPPSTFQNQTIGYKYYENALGDLYKQIMEETNGVGDADVNAFLVDSIMVLHADKNGYNFYNEKTGQAKPEISYAINLLEDCLDLSPDHPLCQHLYIHITEPSRKMVTFSEPVADNLLSRTTGTEAGHLQHMPSHSYVRLGRYHDAIQSNLDAHASDQSYEKHNAIAYGVAHDLAVLIYAAGLSGEKAVALKYSSVLRKNYIDYPNRRDGPGTEMGWHIWRTIRLIFGDFDAILQDYDGIPGGEENSPLENSKENTSWPYATVLGYYSKGVASLWTTNDSKYSKDRLANAKLNLQKLRETIPSVDHGFQGMVSVAESSLDASIQYYQILTTTEKGNINQHIGDFEPVLELIRSARAEQDSWRYTEPPLWHTSLKLCEGTLLRITGQYYEAEEAFKADLVNRPENRFALYGLWKVLEEKGASEEKIQEIQNRFKESSSWADTSVKNSHPLVCPEFGE